jgi:hypothetical protein
MPKRETNKTSHTAKRRKVRAQDSVSSIDAPTAIGDINPAHAEQKRRVSEKAELPPVEYKPLSLDGNSFRVVEILPGPDESIIQCNMRNTTIEEEEYLCLSYTWQPDNPFHEIEINRRIATVGENLWQFLRTARSTSITQPLWIDALCS